MKLNIKKILIVNIFGIGDVLFTTPLISNIKAQSPDIFIGYICNRRTEMLLKTNPKVDRIFVYEKDELSEAAKRSKIQFFKKIRMLFKEIKNEKFDAVIDLSLNKYASVFLMAAGIKERIGYNYKNRSPFLTTKIPFDGYESQHVIDHYLEIITQLEFSVDIKNTQIVIDEKTEEWASVLLKEKGISQKDFVIAVVPGGGESWGKDASLKRWESKKYAILIDKIIEKFSAKIILLGSPEEKNLCSSVNGFTGRKAIDIAGETSLCQSAAILSRSKLAIVNDGGPLHMAVAVGVRTISIFGPVDENVYGPYPKDGHVVATKQIVCRPCYRKFKMARCEHHSCLTALTEDEVFKKVEEVLTQ